MPVSKHNNLYFTAEQKELADRNSSALDYALSQGYELVRQGSYYVMRDHDSMVFKQDGSWFWNSRQLHGRAPEFIMHYEGKTYVEAILTLAGEAEGSRSQSHILPRDSPPKTPFRLPPRSISQKQLYGYLCRTRKLDSRIVKAMIDQKILYQSDYALAPGKFLHNACFVSYDNEGKPCSAFKRGTATVGTPYKGEAPGGDKQYGWIFHGKSPRELYVFEAAIDAGSYASLKLRRGLDPLQGADYLALGGLNFTPIQTYLNGHPGIQTVHLMLDNDKPGQTASADFQKRLEDMGIPVRSHVPPCGKDWNEYLQNVHEQEANIAHRQAPSQTGNRPAKHRQPER